MNFNVEALIPNLADWLNMQPSTVLLLLLMGSASANITSRLIPDDATGALGVVRKVCAILGLYVANRISAGLTVSDVAASVLGSKASQAVTDMAQEPGALIPEVMGEVEQVIKIVPAFPGISKLVAEQKELDNEG